MLHFQQVTTALKRKLKSKKGNNRPSSQLIIKIYIEQVSFNSDVTFSLSLVFFIKTTKYCMPSFFHITGLFKLASQGQVKLDQGQVRLGQLSQATLGQVRLGQVRLGCVTLGQVRVRVTVVSFRIIFKSHNIFL